MLRILQNVKVFKPSIPKRFFHPQIHRLKNDLEKKTLEELEEDEFDDLEDEEVEEDELDVLDDDSIDKDDLRQNFKQIFYSVRKNDFDDGALLREVLRSRGTIGKQELPPAEEEQMFNENEDILRIERVLTNHFRDEKPIQFIKNEMLNRIEQEERSYLENKNSKSLFEVEDDDPVVEEPYDDPLDNFYFNHQDLQNGIEEIKLEEQEEKDGQELSEGVIKGQGEFSEKHFLEEFLHPIEAVNQHLRRLDNLQHFWDESSTIKLWKFFNGKNFRTKEEFLYQVRYSSNEEEIISKLQKEFPKLSQDQVKHIFERLVKVLQKNESKFPDKNELAIEEITNEITETAKPMYLKWIDRYSAIDEKFYGIEKAMYKLYKTKVKKREIRETVKNLRTIDRNNYDNEDDFLYDFLAPLHKTDKSMTATEKRPKEYAPKIYGGISEGYGRRKTSHARVWVTPGTGLFKVNNKPYNQYFNDRFQLSSLAQPFNLLGTFNQFDVKAVVRGGGFSSQCEAVRGGICRAIAGFIPRMGNVYARHKLMTFDRRNVERKKPGRKKARKRFQWVKR